MAKETYIMFFCWKKNTRSNIYYRDTSKTDHISRNNQERKKYSDLF